ncbi:MAG TPA: KUP/HAK/KT family potassium transporter [Candidatus Methylacidiphilales bacterium]|jgi:KUP system potassium uptake protein|nr:KUP/HAK/KT family potassium transporter [Candidatus Methylacidiphilales bacterium]
MSAKPVNPAAVRWLALGSLGVVFGDIGTSPIYTLKQAIQDKPDVLHIEAAVSLIVWYLLLIVTLKYVFFLLRLSNHGEGGVFALLALAKTHVPKQGWLVYVLIIGAALLYGDGMITPAISVLSAVEGLAPPGDGTQLAPSASANPWIAAVILAVLFAVQRFGTRRISHAFAPTMLIWFLTIAALGLPQIIRSPGILWSLNPYIGFSFLVEHPGEAVAMLANVTLAITGAEALYADLSHFSRPAIAIAWNWMVAPCLMINYLGQAAHAIAVPGDVGNLFFSLAPKGGQYPLTLLTIVATVIASQALISGAYSLTQQASNLGYFPRARVLHTNEEHEGQIYLPGINLILAVGAILLVLYFEKSNNLANAYGLAVTGTMITTTIAYAAITYSLKGRFPWIALLLIGLDLSLFLPNSIKFPTGGYIPVCIGFTFALVIISWSRTRSAIRTYLADRVMPLDEFAEATRDIPRVKNTAVVLTATPRVAPITLLHWIKIGQVLHQQVIVLTLTILHEPRVDEKDRLHIVEHDLNLFSVEARFGFMEEVNLTGIEPELRKIVGVPPDRNLYYMLGREILICERRFDLMARIYRKLSAMSRPQAESLRIPLGQAIELGVAIRL